MEQLEYITYKAMMECDQGSAPGLFKPSYNQTVKINSCKVSTAMDKIPLTNVPDFVVCKKTQKKCVPAPTVWQDTYPVKVKGQQTLVGKSCINCTVGGKVTFLTSGQVPLTGEEEDQLNGMRDDVKKAYEEEQAEKNKPWWKKAGEFIVDCVPVVGPIISMAKNISEGNWGMAALDAGFLALDVVGLVAAPFTGGASVAGATAVKIGARQAIKAGVKQVAKKVSKEAIEAGVKQTAEMLSKLSVRNLTRGKLCVFACFPAGTLVATANGHKNIEDIMQGDTVWTYDEVTGETSLQTVTNTLERTTDALVTISTDQVTIQVTPEHPFYADGMWKEAGLLERGDTLQMKNGKQALVTAVAYRYSVVEAGDHLLLINEEHEITGINEPLAAENSVKVYNFEVAEGHTYFVGAQELLVHNVCIKRVIKETGEVVYDLALKMKDEWTAAQRAAAKKKAAALTKADTRVVKKPKRLPDTRGRYKKSGGKVKDTEDVDHIQDLQLDGLDDVTNMNGLDFSVNRSMGRQIQGDIKNLPAGTKIGKVTIN